MITFSALSGSAHSDQTNFAYVLQIDDIRILLDCGAPDWKPEDGQNHWNSYCDALIEIAPSIDLVLLSHGDLEHCGLYAYAHGRWNLKAPAYTTLPVQAMGRIATTENIESLREEEDIGDDPAVEQNPEQLDFQTDDATDTKPTVTRREKYIATLLEVHDAFDSINTLRYSQPIHLSGKCQGLTITPFNGGHTLGGTIWKIRSPSSGTIVYALHMNHMKERHLDGTVLVRQAAGGIFEPLSRPDLFITDADRAAVISGRRRDRDSAFLDAITATLSSRQSLLLPCDASTRVMELLVLLDQYWNFQKLKYPICFLTKTGGEMLTFVRSMMEWLGGTVSKEDVGEDGSGNKEHNRKRRREDDADDDALGAFALRFKHLEIFPNPAALLQRYSSKDPKLILAVPASLSHGPSRQLFTEFATVPGNVVLLTGRAPKGTLGRQLFDRWNESQRPGDKWDQGKIGSNIMMDGALVLKMHTKVPLQGEELEAYQEKARQAREKEAAQKAALERNQHMLEADEDDSDSDSDSDDDEGQQLDGDMDVDGQRRHKSSDDWAGMDIDEGYTKQLLSFDIYVKGNVSKGTSFFKSTGTTTQRFRMFPYIEKKRRVDQYGETIDVGMSWKKKLKPTETKYYRRKHAEEEAKKAIQEVPSKFITTEVEVQLACRLLYVDMEVKSIIVVGASSTSAESLVTSCASIRSMTKDIMTPKVGESVQIGQQISSYPISIGDELLASIRMSKFEDNEIGYIRGRVVAHASSTIPILEPAAVESPAQVAVKPPRMLGARPSKSFPSSTMIGELKLTVLKSRLTTLGIKAELVGEGVLICGAAAMPAGEAGPSQESVAVRKFGRTKVEIEGNVSDIYYTIREEIYKLYASVSS
ncbi:beta-lactamase-like protein [Flagelloscypha sp. PMI_526]|nr:beta-lactamase-like protein [Flagelloscypha sp. PMI_526]